MEDKDKQVGSIITSTGMKFEYNESQDSYISSDPLTGSAVTWIHNDPSHPMPSITSTPVSRRINVQAPPLQPGQFGFPVNLSSSNNQDSGNFFSLLDPDTLKQMSSIMEQDTVYIRTNTIASNEAPPVNGSSLKVQIHKYPHDWDNSVLIFMSKSYSVDSMMKANSIAELICVIITMSGRDIIFNDKEYNPNGE